MTSKGSDYLKVRFLNRALKSSSHVLRDTFRVRRCVGHATFRSRLYCIEADQIGSLPCSGDDFSKTFTAAGRASQIWLRTPVESPNP
jgi:hypothetical protein